MNGKPETTGAQISIGAGTARAIALAMLVAVLGCETAPQAPAAVEDRSAAPGAAVPGAAAPAPGAVEARPVPGAELASRAEPDAAARALRDPASPLSKRAIYYDFDKYDVKDDYKPVVDVHARYLRENPGARMLIQGNTDERGGREYNLALGQRRAEGVRRLLILLGAREEQIEAVSLGEEKPRAAGSNEQAYAENRRSDILYKGEY